MFWICIVAGGMALHNKNKPEMWICSVLRMTVEVFVV